MTCIRLWAILNLAGLICSVAGSLFLAYSLTLTPSNFRLVKTGEKKLAICLDNNQVVAGYGGGLVVSDDACPDAKQAGTTPQITANRPAFALCGLLLVIVGFLLQLPAAYAAVSRKP